MPAAQRMAMLIDVSRCIACRGCQVACKQWNRLPAEPVEKRKFTGTYQNQPGLSPRTWTLIHFIEQDDPSGNTRWLFRKEQCYHCGDAPCAMVCPSKAIKKHDNGIVTIDQKKCEGKQFCREKCPFKIPQLDPKKKKTTKCHMCLDRVVNGLKPACAAACPSGTISFGTRKEMLKLGEERLPVLLGTNPHARLYGKTELGGLGVMYLLPEQASIYGLPDNPQLSYDDTVWWLLGIIPGLAALYGLLRYYQQEPSPDNKTDRQA